METRARALEQARATALKARLEAAHKKLCEACANGGRIRMSIPTQPDDTDIVIGRALSEAIAYFTEAMLAVDPPPSGASPQAHEDMQGVAGDVLLEVTRLEVIGEAGRLLTLRPVTVESVQFQDNDRTLKIFVKGDVAPASPQAETFSGEIRQCGALHTQTGAFCELLPGHLENHRGAFRGGVAQWPYPAPVSSVEPTPPHTGWGVGNLRDCHCLNCQGEPTPEPPQDGGNPK